MIRNATTMEFKETSVTVSDEFAKPMATIYYGRFSPRKFSMFLEGVDMFLTKHTPAPQSFQPEEVDSFDEALNAIDPWFPCGGFSTIFTEEPKLQAWLDSLSAQESQDAK